MKRRFLFTAIVCCILLPLKAQKGSAEQTDSVMERVFTYTSRNGLDAEDFTANLYMRHLLETKRKNIAMRYLPGMFPLERGKHTYIVENQLRYTYRYDAGMDWRNVAAGGTLPYKYITMDDKEMSRFKLSIYEPNLLSDRILSPLNRHNRRFYTYEYINEYADSAGNRHVHIAVEPRFHNTQLVAGSFDVEMPTGAVREFNFNFSYNLTHYSFTGEPGKEGIASLLPERISLYSSTSFLGNKVYGYYEGLAAYAPAEPLPADSLPRLRRYDLTQQYRQTLDTSKIIHGRAYFDSLRPLPLSPREEIAYLRSRAVGDSSSRRRRFRLSSKTKDLIFGKHTWEIGRKGEGHLNVPAIITPSMAGWSKSAGFALRTRFGLDYTFSRGQHIALNPRLGYNFKQNRFYWQTPLSFVLLPRHDFALHLEARGGDVMYSSEQADEVRRQLEGFTHYDSLMNVFDHYEFDYYRDFQFAADLSLRPLPGLTLSLGGRYHHRSLKGWNEISAASGMQRYINSFAPRAHLEWTPFCYYIWRKGRRLPIHSNWPTFLLDYERGIDIGGCHSRYERWETDIKWQRKLRALRRLYLRLGGGLYSSRGGAYFLDFDYFRDNNMPGDWRDELSGQFQLLDSRWYNESQYYARFSMSYESPMLLFSRVKYLSTYIQKERLYCNLLSVQRLAPYVELGYGLSTHIFDVGAFVGLGRGQQEFGCKFILRLFEDQ